MKSTFFYKEHPKHSDYHEVSIEADYVTFERGWVVFHQSAEYDFQSSFVATRPNLIIKAVQNSVCHDLREVLNE